MNDHLLDDLRAANPVPDPDALELPATLAARALAGPEPRAPRAPRRRLLPAAGVLAAAGAAVAFLLLALGGGGAGTPDLAARAYAASAAHGVTHWRIDMAGFDANGRQRSHQRQEGWKRGATMHVVWTEFHHSRPHVSFDYRQVGRRTRAWMSVSDTYNDTTLPKRRTLTGEDVTFRFGDPMVAFRLAYQQHRLRDLGGGRFGVVFKHISLGDVVYEVEPETGRPLRLVLSGNPKGTREVWTFTTYESLPDTQANRDRLLLLPHPGAGPGDEDPATWFRALRDGARPPARWQAVIDKTAGARRFGEDPSTARVLTKDVFLVAGRHYVCMDSVSMPSGSPKLARMLGPSLGGTCVPIKKALANGIAVGLGDSTILAVRDGVRAVDARRWTGAWRRFPVRGGYVRLPGGPSRGSYQVRLVS
ncbi:hypothetical protein [Conexibacter woesei]|uniref:hypothetical protein n=1 Tax=Conexibacter woesei TaxID=191495 RepID=UPI00040EDF77|nr:hypothetical protein [Conexibacter woesei]